MSLSCNSLIATFNSLSVSTATGEIANIGSYQFLTHRHKRNWIFFFETLYFINVCYRQNYIHGYARWLAITLLLAAIFFTARKIMHSKSASS